MGNDPLPERAWDEYDWERFMQQQDRRTEKYMELLEKYLDHPDRDRIIAREMGWDHLLDAPEPPDDRDAPGDFDPSEVPDDFDELEEESDDDPDDAPDADPDEDDPDSDDDPESPEDEPDDDRDVHPLYAAAFGLTLWIDRLFASEKKQAEHPAAGDLAAQAALASAKLAAALRDDDVDELGMTIAYLKRALRAITKAMDAASELHRARVLPKDEHATLIARLFEVRDGIISLMGEYRAEWRRRFGPR